MFSRLIAAFSVFLVFNSTPCFAKPLASDSVVNPRDQEVQPVHKDIYGDPLPHGAIARLGTIRFRGDKRTLTVAYHPSGAFVASGDSFGAVHLWDVATGEELEVVYSPALSLSRQQISFSPDGQYLTYLTRHGQLFWEMDAKTSFGLSQSWTPIAFSPDSKMAAGISGQDLVVFDLKKRSVKTTLGRPKAGIRAVTFSPDGKLVATTESRDFNQPSVIRLWDVAAGKQIANWVGHQRLAPSLSFSPDGKILASGGGDNTCLWEIANHSKHATLDDPAEVVAFTPDGKLLATAGYSNAIHLWDPIARKKVRSIQTGNGWVSSLAFSPDGKKILTGGWHHALHLWDVATGKEILPREGHRFDLHSVQFSPDGKMLASRSGDQSILLWEIATTESSVRKATVFF